VTYGLGLDDGFQEIGVGQGRAVGENGLSVIVCFAHKSYKIRISAILFIYTAGKPGFKNIVFSF